MKVKEESEQASLKLNIQKTKMIDLVSHFMAQRWGKIDSIFLGSKITENIDCSHEI